VGKVAGIAGRLDFISDPEGKALPTLTPRGRVMVVVTIKEWWGQRLQVGCEVHGGRSLVNSVCIAGDVDDHETLLHFHTYENSYVQPYKNVCKNARGPGQMVRVLSVRNQDL
jgi:hypothetical protein